MGVLLEYPHQKQSRGVRRAVDLFHLQNCEEREGQGPPFAMKGAKKKREPLGGAWKARRSLCFSS